MTRLSLIRHRGFARFLIGRSISLTGSAVAPIALTFAMLDNGAEPLGLGIVLASGFLPQLVMLFIGGAVADRRSRSGVMVVCNVAAGISQALIALCIFSDLRSVAILALLSAISGAASAFYAPASRGVLSTLIDKNELHEATATIRLVTNVIKIAGPIVGGLGVAALGAAAIIAWDSFTFMVAALVFYGLRLGDVKVSNSGIRQDLATGWSEFISRRWLVAIVMQYSIVSFLWMAAFQLLGPVALKHQGGGAKEWGLVLSAFAAGLIIGTVAMLKWRPRRPLVVANIGTALSAAPLLGLGFSLHILVIAAFAVIGGFGTELFIVLWSTAINTEIPPEILGRVSAYDMIGGMIFIPVAYVVGGPLASVFGTALVQIVAFLLIIFSVFAVHWTGRLREVRAVRLEVGASGAI